MAITKVVKNREGVEVVLVLQRINKEAKEIWIDVPQYNARIVFVITGHQLRPNKQIRINGQLQAVVVPDKICGGINLLAAQVLDDLAITITGATPMRVITKSDFTEEVLVLERLKRSKKQVIISIPRRGVMLTIEPDSSKGDGIYITRRRRIGGEQHQVEEIELSNQEFWGSIRFAEDLLRGSICVLAPKDWMTNRLPKNVHK